MDPRARRFAIREHLNTARAALDRGDRTAALRSVNAALVLDPEYLAAQAMKERVEGASELQPELPATAPVSPTPGVPDRRERPRFPDDTPPLPAPAEPLISAEGWARFESRARARRAEKRAAAARTLIARRRFGEARSVLEEIHEIDPAHPDLISLSIELDAAEHLQPRSSWHWGPAAAAAVVFGVLLLGARYLEMPGAAPASTPPAPVAAVHQPPAAPAASQPGVSSRAEADVLARDTPDRSTPVSAAPVEASATREEAPSSPPATSRVPSRPAVDVDVDAERARVEARTTAAPPRPTTVVEPVPARVEEVAAASGVAERPTPEPPGARPTPPLAPAVVPAALPGAVPTAPPPEAPPQSARTFDRETTPAALRTGGAAAIATVPEEERVRRTLQMYQSAYEALDAQSARAVWPRVDGAALQRAFDGLQSQRLTFDTCQVQVRGSSGSAVCHGSMRYVPKVGSREPRIEPRTWTFALRKAGDAWQIDTARAEQ